MARRTASIGVHETLQSSWADRNGGRLIVPTGCLLGVWECDPVRMMSPEIGWWVGGGEPYLPLSEGIGGDIYWTWFVMIVNSAMVVGCGVAAWRWRNYMLRLLTSPESRVALARIWRLFVVAALAGYLSLVLVMHWPLWHIQSLLLLPLTLYVWWVALRGHTFRRLCRRFARAEQLHENLQVVRSESRRKTFCLNALGHDLRNPLYALALQIEMVEHSLRANEIEQACESLALVRQCSYEANDLLDNFLELGRLDWTGEEIDPQPLDLMQLIRTVVAAATPVARRKGLALRLIGPDMLGVMTDRRKLDRVLSNLVSNAIKYTTQGEIRVQVEVMDHHVRIDVIDTGAGIPPHQQQNIFDEFFQLDTQAINREKGHGLGLTIVRRLLDHLGGRIELHSVVGKGSCFSVILPKFLNLKGDLLQDPDPLAVADC